MKSILFAVMMILIATNHANALGNFSMEYHSRYLLNNGAIASEKPVIQSTIFLELPKGFYGLGFWSAGLDDPNFNSNFGDEIDVLAGWSQSFGKFNVDIGGGIYALYDIQKLRDDFYTSYCNLSYSLRSERHGFKPYVYYEHLESASGNTRIDLIRASLTYTWTISPRWSWSHDLGLANEIENSTFIRYRMDVTWKPMDRWSLYTGAKIMYLLTDEQSGRTNDHEWFFGTKITF